MRIKTLLLAVCLLSLAASGYAQSYMDEVARSVLAEVNMMRQNPSAYARYLEEQLQYMGSDKVLRRPGEVGLITSEGRRAIEEAIQALRNAPAMAPYEANEPLTRAASDHARDIGSRGLVSHTGSDGSTMGGRIDRYGNWMGTIGENISFGYSNARDIVIQLLIDDGVTSRGHRKALLNTEYRSMGVAYSPHKVYGHCCVMDFASSIKAK